MSSPSAHAEQERTRRGLRLRIGRLRRRIDGRIHATRRKTRQLASWRTYAKRYPGSAVTVALGVGLALSAGLSARRLSGWLGMRLIRRVIDRAGQQIWRELERIWADSTPQKDAATTSGDDGDRA
jgi:hypothetical protein